MMRAQLATVSGGLAPDVYVNAWWDWYLNLAKEPSTQLNILQDALAKATDNWNFTLQAAAGQPLKPTPRDARYAGGAWNQWPFNVFAHSYANYADWWGKAWSGVPGVAPENERTLKFVAANALEVLSPANYLATNPELLETTRAESGQNLVRGFSHWLEDVERTLESKAPAGIEAFVVGRDVAATPGKVVWEAAAATAEEYVALAVQVARVHATDEFRRGLVDALPHTPLFRVREFVEALERAYSMLIEMGPRNDSDKQAQPVAIPN